MANLLKKLNAYHTCIRCGKKKPLSDFQLISKANEKAVYDKICLSCRQTEPVDNDDDDSGGGKQLTLKADYDAKAVAKKQHQHEEDVTSETKEAYLEKLDNLHKDDLKEKAKQQDNLIRKKRFFDQALNLLKRTSKSLFPADKKQDRTNTELGFDPDVHDPLRQIPVTEHHNIFMTHPDRTDVRFLLEYVLSGHYAQNHRHLGASNRHASTTHYTAQGHAVSHAATGQYAAATAQAQVNMNVALQSSSQPVVMAQLNNSSAQYSTLSSGSTLLTQSLVAVGATHYIAHQIQHPVAPTFLNEASPGMFNQSNISATGFSGAVARNLAVSQRAMANPAYFQFARADTSEEVVENTNSEEQAQKIISYMSQTWK